jgi:DNA-binding winged helix-turn-helix (wHTH) protein
MRRMAHWLNTHGFTTNPFAINQADQEGEALSDLFIDRPYFGLIRGDPSFPRTAFLAAKRGEGKTATCKMVAYDVSRPDTRASRALAVEYFDFGPMLAEAGNNPALITARHHASALARVLLNALSLKVYPVRFESLDETDRGLLLGVAQEYADSATVWRLSKALRADPITNIDWRTLSPVELLGELTQIVLRLRGDGQPLFRSVYFLVDRVDESPSGLAGAGMMLRSLVEERPLLEMPRVAFKFFLPDVVLEQVRRLTSLREDRVLVASIKWDASALTDMLEQRLAYFSEHRVETFEALCHPTLKTSQWAWRRMLPAAKESPRNLLRLCDLILQRRLASNDPARLYFLRDDVEAAIAELKHQYELEDGVTRSEVAAPILGAAGAASAPPLRLDDSGHVWRNGVLMSPPLSDLEFRLLKALYRQSPEIVSNEQLIEAIWPDADESDGSEAYDKQNLRKLVARLRERLETPGVEEHEALVRNARGRGYWLNLAVPAADAAFTLS